MLPVAAVLSDSKTALLTVTVEQQILGPSNPVAAPGFVSLGSRLRRRSSASSKAFDSRQSSPRSGGDSAELNVDARASTTSGNPVLRLVFRARSFFAEVPFLKTNVDFVIDKKRQADFDRYTYSNRVLSFGRLILYLYPILLFLDVLFFIVSRREKTDPVVAKVAWKKLIFNLIFQALTTPLVLVFLFSSLEFATANRRPIAALSALTFVGMFCLAEYTREMTIEFPLFLVTEIILPVTAKRRRFLLLSFFVAHIAVVMWRRKTLRDEKHCKRAIIEGGLIGAEKGGDGEIGDYELGEEGFDVQGFIRINDSEACQSIPSLIFSYVVFFVSLFVIRMITHSVEVKTFVVISGLHDSKVALAINMQQELTRQADFNKGQLKMIEELKKNINNASNNAKGGPSGGKGGPDKNDDRRLEVKLEHLEFRQRLGQGSFGTVWAAIYRDPDSGEGMKVAVKMLNPESATEDNIQRFGFEIGMHLGLTHEGIIKMIGAVMAPPKLCLVLKLAKHGTLTKVLLEGTAVAAHSEEHDEEEKEEEPPPLLSGPAPQPEDGEQQQPHTTRGLGKSWVNLHSSHGPNCNLRSMLSNIACGLSYCHGLGLSHRDVKSDNCLVYSDWTCVLSDFGEAKKLDTDNNTSVGTPYYVAPEVFRGDDRYDEKCDVYSFGVLLGCALYGGEVSDFFFWDKSKKLRLRRFAEDS